MIEFGDYNYPSQIKTPDDLGIGTKGTMKQLRYNVAGMIDYINILVTGKSPASKANGGPLFSTKGRVVPHRVVEAGLKPGGRQAI